MPYQVKFEQYIDLEGLIINTLEDAEKAKTTLVSLFDHKFEYRDLCVPDLREDADPSRHKAALCFIQNCNDMYLNLSIIFDYIVRIYDYAKRAEAIIDSTEPEPIPQKAATPVNNKVDQDTPEGNILKRMEQIPVEYIETFADFLDSITKKQINLPTLIHKLECA